MPLNTINLVFALLTWLHSFYISISDVNYDKENQNIQISSRIFADDLEKALQNKYDHKADLLNNLTQSSDFIARYMEENFLVDINHKELKLNYLGAELEDDAVWIYLESKKVRKIKFISIRNTALQEIYEGQKNMIKVNIKNEIKSLKLTKDKPKGVLKF